MKLTGVVSVSAALALGASACGKSNDDGGGSGKGVTIAFVGAQTGDNAQLGINISNGAKLAIDQYNATNPKVKVTLKMYDTKGDPAVAPGQAQKAIQDKVDAIIGPAFSGRVQGRRRQLRRGPDPEHLAVGHRPRRWTRTAGSTGTASSPTTTCRV